MDGLYTSLSGAMTLEQRLQAVTHDLANLNTPGHKRTRLVAAADYPTILAGLIHQSDPRGLDTEAPSAVPLGDQIYTRIAEAQIDFSQGGLRATGLATDLALDGPGFFVVDVDGRELFTRAGNFELNALGQIVLRAGDRWAPVLSEAGVPITAASADFDVLSDGTVQDRAGNVLGTLRVVDFADPQRLERVGFTLFADPSGQAGLRQVPAGERRVRQGMLELSNADPVQSLVAMIEIERTYQAVAKAMSTLDEATGRRIGVAMR